MKKNLIPTDIKKGKGQKEEWNNFWREKKLQKFLGFTRKVEYWLYLFTILKKYKNVVTFCELGCGSSVLLTKLSKSVNKITGIDYSQKSLEKSRNLFQKLKIKNFQLINADIRNPKIKNKFNVVFSNGLIEHFDDPGKIILNHLKITKDGGYTIIIVPYKYSYKNLWYYITRPKPLQKYWPYPEQIFFTKKSLEYCYNKYCSKYNYNYKIKVLNSTANVILIVHKT